MKTEVKMHDYSLDMGVYQLPWRLYETGNLNDKSNCVLWLQGWTSTMDGHREGVERMSALTNTDFVALNYAGHGDHPVRLEDSTQHQQHDEVVAVFDEAIKMGYEKIIAIGGSFGAFMAALLAGVRPVHALVLRAPAIYANNEFDMKCSDTPKWIDAVGYQKDRSKSEFIEGTNAVKAVQSFDGMTYVLEHEDDEIVPKIMPQAYFEHAKHGNYIVIPKTNHSPKTMQNPQPHFDYIEHWVTSIVNAVKLQGNLV